MLGIRLSKIKTRPVQLRLPVDLLDAVREMGLAAPDEPRDLKGMIECALLFAIWSHSRGQGPDAQMLRQPNGYTECDLILRARRERREVEYLDKLYSLKGDAQ